MRFSKIFVPYEQTKEKKLKEINLTKKKLGSTVALVGKNGAGKSRVLEHIANYLKYFSVEKFFDGHISEIPNYLISPFEANLTNAENQIRAIERNNALSELQKNSLLVNAKQEFTRFLQSFQQLGQAYIKVVDNDDLKVIKSNINNNPTLSFEKILTNKHFDNIVANPNLISQAIANPQKPSEVLLNEFTAFNNQSTIQYLTSLSNRIATDEFNLFLQNRQTPDIVNQKIKNQDSYKLFDKFQNYVKQFLGKDFSYRQTTSGNTISSTLYYNDSPFNLTYFSPGQKTLFAYAILFFYLDVNSKTNIRESIIIIDEPEKHLHPEAQITLINALKSIVSKSGQLWIATHSVHILSHLEFDEIFMVRDDEILTPSRTIPGKSFNELMGLEEHILELTTFINSISEWAYGNFMTQCFKEPEVVLDNNINDPQFRLFKEFLIRKSKTDLLDFGAGKGRIGYTLQEDEDASKKIQYWAYEPNKGNYELLNKVPNIKKTFSNILELEPDIFDCVLMCNVLHEINPKEWVETLLAIKKTLKETGYLIILEDKFLPKGETAHEFGYLILGKKETDIFMNSSSSLELKLTDPEYTERISFIVYSKNEINPTSNSVVKSIESLNETAYNEIKLLKRMNRDNYQGRRLANETQIYINSKMALEGLKNK